jgi:hypothetical protein
VARPCQAAPAFDRRPWPRAQILNQASPVFKYGALDCDRASGLRHGTAWLIFRCGKSVGLRSTMFRSCSPLVHGSIPAKSRVPPCLQTIILRSGRRGRKVAAAYMPHGCVWAAQGGLQWAWQSPSQRCVVHTAQPHHFK